jgi:hypothetical protein
MKLLRLLPLTALFTLLHLPLPAQEAPPPEEAEEAAAPATPAKPKEKPPYKPYIHSSKPGAPKVRLFILSGQSNMHYLKPDTSFTPTVSAAFPEDDVVIVKDAEGGQPIRKWLADWKAPVDLGAPKNAGNGRGTLYTRLKGSIATAMEGKPKPVSVTFVWMQGETDTGTDWAVQIYEKSLQDLIALVRQDMDAPGMTVVIGRINDCVLKGRKPENWEAVRVAQVKVAEADGRGAWIDTDDLNGPRNGLHFPAAGYTEMGKRFAEKAITLVNKDG